MIGGTAWKITKDEEEHFVYAVDVNHKNEYHLDGFQIDRITKPNLLITDGFNANYAHKRKKDRDEQLVQVIMKTTGQGGNVLIACDTSGRIMELAMFLDTIFSKQTEMPNVLNNVNLVIVSNVSQSTFDQAKNMIEWMSERVIEKFTRKREQPYDFKHIKLCQTLSEGISALYYFSHLVQIPSIFFSERNTRSKSRPSYAMRHGEWLFPGPFCAFVEPPEKYNNFDFANDARVPGTEAYWESDHELDYTRNETPCKPTRKAWKFFMKKVLLL